MKSVSAATKKKLQEKWRKSKRRCRARDKATKAIMELTPQSPQAHDQPSDHEVINEGPVPVASSTPTHSPKEIQRPVKPKGVKKKSAVKKQLKKLMIEKENLIKQVKAEKRKAERFRRQNQRLIQRQNIYDKNTSRPKQSKRGEKAQQRKKQVESFLIRDENSRLLPGKKDTIGRKVKMQRRVLAKSLVDLHKEYKQTCEAQHAMSYRQFVRYKPFFVFFFCDRSQIK